MTKHSRQSLFLLFLCSSVATSLFFFFFSSTVSFLSVCLLSLLLRLLASCPPLFLSASSCLCLFSVFSSSCPPLFSSRAIRLLLSVLLASSFLFPLPSSLSSALSFPSSLSLSVASSSLPRAVGRHDAVHVFPLVLSSSSGICLCHLVFLLFFFFFFQVISLLVFLQVDTEGEASEGRRGGGRGRERWRRLFFLSLQRKERGRESRGKQTSSAPPTPQSSPRKTEIQPKSSICMLPLFSQSTPAHPPRHARVPLFLSLHLSLYKQVDTET